MKNFVRCISDPNLISKLRSHNLFSEKILNDAKKYNVFSAVRNNAVHFYFYGSRLFEFRGDFRTHRKFIPISGNRNYFSEDELKKQTLSASFFDNYEEIKIASKVYSTIEANGLFSLYSKYGYFNDSSNVIAIDIEISFESEKEDSEQDRIDLLLMNKSTGMLMFVEGKHYSNPDIWSVKGTKPRVVRQVERYNTQIKNRANEIVKNYKNYVQNLNQIFDLKIPTPSGCLPSCGLYIFGFDEDQKKGRLSDLLLKDGSLQGVGFYCKGKTTDTNPNTLWCKIEKTANSKCV